MDGYNGNDYRLMPFQNFNPVSANKTGIPVCAKLYIFAWLSSIPVWDIVSFLENSVVVQCTM